MAKKKAVKKKESADLEFSDCVCRQTVHGPRNIAINEVCEYTQSGDIFLVRKKGAKQSGAPLDATEFNSKLFHEFFKVK